MLPSDFDGPPAPDGTPNTYIEVDFPEGYPTTERRSQQDRECLKLYLAGERSTKGLPKS
jgi:hypothetical protein